MTGKAKATLPDNTEAFSQTYPLKKNYAFFNWSNDLEQEMELSGTFLKASNDKNGYGNALPSYPAFGYADCGLLPVILKHSFKSLHRFIRHQPI